MSAAPPGMRSCAPYGVAAVAVSAFVYYPVTRAFFHGDDFLNLYEIVNGGVARFLLGMHGGHLLVSSNASFALLFHLFGAEPGPYLWTAFLTHLLNVVLLFALLVRLTASPALACFGATLWGTLPSNEGSLGWFSVYGHVLATTCVLAATLLLARLAEGARRLAGTLLAVFVLLIVASTSFGVGLGVTMAMPAVAFLLLPPGAGRRRAVFAVALLAAAVPLMYFGAQRLSAAAYGRSPAMAYQLAALRYWRNTLRLLLELVGHGVACLVYGTVHQPAAPGQLATAGALSLVATAAVLARADGRARLRALAFLSVAAGAYAVIAAGRTLIGRGAKIALVAGSTRYHYLGVAALAVVACLLLLDLARRSPRLSGVGRAILPLWIASLLVVHALRGPTARDFAFCRRETMGVIAGVRAAAAAAAPGANVDIENRGFRCVGPLLQAARTRFPGWAGVFAIYFPTNDVDGRRVRFLESDARAIAKASQGRRTAGLLLSYEDVGRTPPAEVPVRRGAVVPVAPQSRTSR